MKHLLSVNDLTEKEIHEIFRKTNELKKSNDKLLKDKTLGMIFAKPSTRTRVSFEVAMTQLGGHAIYMGMNDLQLGRGETIADTAKVLSRYVDVIMARLFDHNNIEELAQNAAVPVINGLTDLLHPCQALSDMYTIREKFKRLKGLKLVFIGDGNNNVTHSLLYACSKLGVNITVACPPGYEPMTEILVEAENNAGKSGAEVKLMQNPKEAVKDADIVYTDVWVSMGREKEKEKRMNDLKPYQVNSELLKNAKNAVVMHCLPAHREQEITDEVMDGPRSIVFDQAENRLHVQKAILAMLVK
jgi:ornithine carbamoyltransferase